MQIHEFAQFLQVRYPKICEFATAIAVHEFAPFLQVRYPEIREFATAIAQNISDLEGQPWKSKLLRMSFLVRLGSLTVLR